MGLLHILIVLFVCIILYQIISNFIITNTLVEGMDTATDTNISSTTSSTSSPTSYQPYNLNDPNSALILSQQNSGNIDYLKGRVDELSGIKKDVDDLKQNVSLMQTQIDGLVQQQADFGTQLAGSTPPDISGTEGVTVDTATAEPEEEQK